MPAFCFLSERRRTRISSSVRSGSAAINSISHCLCCSNGERLCPVPGLASTFPVFLQRFTHRIVVEAPRLRMRAASRALSPDSTSSTARTLRSLEYPFAIACPRMLPQETPNLICGSEGIPRDRSDSQQLETALVLLSHKVTFGGI